LYQIIKGRNLDIKKATLNEAIEKKIITIEQSTALIQLEILKNGESFSLANILYYLGGVIAIGAMTIFMNLGWEEFGGIGVALISLLYAFIGISLANEFKSNNYNVPSAICCVFVICLTPLAVYGVQQALGLWPTDLIYKDYHRYVRWYWLYMELSTIAVGAIMIWHYKHPLLTMPISMTLWYLSMDITQMISPEDYNWDLRKLVSTYFGLFMIALAFLIEIRARKNKGDYAFWLYLFGVIAFWSGIMIQNSDSETSKVMYLFINTLMILFGVTLMRKIFVIFGSMGICIYVGHIASHIFKDSFLFPFALTALGFLVICLGVLWQKHEKDLSNKIKKILPKGVQELISTIIERS
jgi:hypothetical protein